MNKWELADKETRERIEMTVKCRTISSSNLFSEEPYIMFSDGTILWIEGYTE